MAQGSTSVSWISAGGTSLSTPRWAGLLAVANALRAQGGKGLARPAARHALQQRRQDARHAARHHHRQQWQLQRLRGSGRL